MTCIRLRWFCWVSGTVCEPWTDWSECSESCGEEGEEERMQSCTSGPEVTTNFLTRDCFIECTTTPAPTTTTTTVTTTTTTEMISKFDQRLDHRNPLIKNCRYFNRLLFCMKMYDYVVAIRCIAEVDI